MTMDDDVVGTRLELIAAKAKLLAMDVRRGMLNAREAKAGIQELMDQSHAAYQDADEQ